MESLLQIIPYIILKDAQKRRIYKIAGRMTRNKLFRLFLLKKAAYICQ